MRPASGAEPEPLGYREFLRKFSVLKEEMKVDMDTFDYIFYNYGMNLYGNMPLIEPLETKEERKVEDFVIVIDTSMSCKGELVQKFLEETYSVLSESESYFRRIHVHILQCDEKIQSDVVIENAMQLKEYMSHFTVKGGGGTDFRPGLCLCGAADAGEEIYKASGTDLFYRRLWNLSCQNASLRDGFRFHEGGLPGH